jgi:luciferase family oxidoreductase group 1
MPSFRLNVLDQSPIPEGLSIGDALRNSIDLAKTADRCGYHRYWLAEHHGTPGLACNSPEVMVGPVAAATKNLRVGTGGIMLPHYSPLKVAETFLMLAGLYPDRIDLGLGRAPGTSGRVAHFLQRDRRQPPPDDFPQQLTELLGYLDKSVCPPAPALLGSSPQSAVWAAELNLPYVFADFINPSGEPYAGFYRDQFIPTEKMPKPHTSVCVWAVCAETDEAALRLSLSARMMMLMLFRGKLIPVPPIETAEEFLAAEGVAVEALPAGRRVITGSPTKVRSAIEAVAEDYGAQEVFVVNILYDHAARVRSYELLAEVFELATTG